MCTDFNFCLLTLNFQKAEMIPLEPDAGNAAVGKDIEKPLYCSFYL